MGDIHRVDGTPRQRLIGAAATSVGTSLLFIVVYGATSWVTSLRSDIGTLFFSWERAIPFIPVMIIPYMSIDLFFVGAPFICSDGAERRLLAKRISFAILTSGAFFLIMPLQFAFDRPVPPGWLGSIYTFLHGFDRPFNMFPSLHIALRTILADTYTRHSRGVMHWALHLWFSLIGFSTVLTYQHHLIDIAGGFVLAAFCFYLFRVPSGHPRTLNRPVGVLYALGAALCAAAAALGGWWVVLLWPASALTLVSAAYFGLVANVFRKEHGRLPLSSLCILAPVILGHRLSLLFYQQQAEPWNEIMPGLWVGRQLRGKEAVKAVADGVTAVLDLTSEFSEASNFRSIRYLNLAVLDLTAPTPGQLAEAADFIDRGRKEGVVYVHCKIGYSRSAAVVGAYLRRNGVAGSADEAIARMKDARPSMIVRPEALEVIQRS